MVYYRKGREIKLFLPQISLFLSLTHASFPKPLSLSRAGGRARRGGARTARVARRAARAARARSARRCRWLPGRGQGGQAAARAARAAAAAG